jgi:hypothetical protein
MAPSGWLAVLPGRIQHSRSSPTITLNTYVGEWPGTDSETRSIIDAALGSVPRMCPVPLPGGKVRG